MKPKTITKRSFVQQLRAKGLSVRKATKGVNAVFDAWKTALSYCEQVETPCGMLEVVPTNGKDRRNFQKLRKIQTQELMFRVAKYPGRRRVIKLRPNLKLDPTPQQLSTTIPPPPPPHSVSVSETDEERRTRQLAGELLGGIADNSTMAQLRKAVVTHPREPGAFFPSKPGALLRRLQEFKDRGWHFGSVDSLARQVTAHFWL